MIGLREPGDEAIPGYQLVCPIGSGGFGDVWKCIAPGGLYKAIKFVFGNLNALDGDQIKAEQEFKALERVKSVRHPFVLSMDRIEVVAGELLIVMELADRSLHDCLVESQLQGLPGIPRALLLSFLSDAAEGLDHLIEKHNLQHLDVKPKNLFIIADRVKVADFGLVKHLERQSSAGLMGGATPVYAAPETFASKISKHSDQYSLAIVYIELLTGQRPFQGKNIRQLALQHMTEAPNLAMLPPEDRPVVAKALSKNPDERFPSCSAFVRALAGIQTSTPVTTSPSANAIPENNASIHEATPAPRVGNVPSTSVMSRAYSDQYLSATMSHLDVGVLKPAILIGVGSFGRRAVQQIRCRLLDRVGDLSAVPSFRFVYIDIDPDTPEKVLNDASDSALLPEHVLHLPLQPVTGYRRKQLDQILEWLPREKLYSIPRSLTPEGSRAYGRLAFFDHYLKLTTRLKHEIQTAIHPEAIQISAHQTGLSPREKAPSIYIFAGATGSSSGMLLDLGHAIRRVLAKVNMPDAPVSSFIYCGAPEDPASPPGELANIFATLTELNHFADPDVLFTARYGGVEGPKVEAHGLPFSATYLLPMAERTGEAFRDCISHLSGYISQELTTPLGLGLENLRRTRAAVGRTPFRGFGTFGVWFPRGLLLRSGARQLCADMLRSWAIHNATTIPPIVDTIMNGIYSDARLRADSIQQFIVQESQHPGEGNALESIGRWYLSAVEQIDSATRRGEGANWAHATWDQTKDLIGFEPTTDQDSPYRRGRLSRLLDTGLASALDAWMNELAELTRPLYELRGPRLLAAEIILRKIETALQSAAIAQEQQANILLEKRTATRNVLQTALEATQVGGGNAGLFGGRSPRAQRTFGDRLKEFIDARVAEDLNAIVARFYRRLCEKMTAQLRETIAAREQIAALVERLEQSTHSTRGGAVASARAQADIADEAMQTTLQLSNTIRVVLPNGDDQLDRAAAGMLLGLSIDHLNQLQDIVEQLVIAPRGGLLSLCQSSNDLSRVLSTPIIEQTTAFLADKIPTQDVTEIEFSSQEAQSGNLHRRIANYLRLASPLTPGPSNEEKTYVLVPATAHGHEYAKEVRKQVAKAVIVTLQGEGTDLMFCREQGLLRPVDLLKLIEPCFDAYTNSIANVDTSPHCRFDVTEWMPLVEG